MRTSNSIYVLISMFCLCMYLFIYVFIYSFIYLFIYLLIARIPSQYSNTLTIWGIVF